ncbi:hypothetical protein HRR77_000260 [Exophiala dermatitidis]|nr:hypothetical protein HRR77_000260 [Exophiala dermatitidis]KAJ4589964.1 hypothetical protein HRR82_000349 [Exophiala dermatitidis]
MFLRQLHHRYLRAVLACVSFCQLENWARCTDHTITVVGRTSERLRDPSMRDPESINGDCMIHGFLSVFTGLAWIFTMMKRTEIREQFGIPGSSFGDCCTAYWCPCCAVIQQDNEVKFRLKPVADMTQQPYQPQQDQMVMQNSFASAPPNYTPAPNYPPAQK